MVGTSDVIARVNDLQPAADGRVWVLNSNAPAFVVFGPDGRVEREFGRAGGGPAEFGAPWRSCVRTLLDMRGNVTTKQVAASGRPEQHRQPVIVHRTARGDRADHAPTPERT